VFGVQIKTLTIHDVEAMQDTDVPVLAAVAPSAGNATVVANFKCRYQFCYVGSYANVQNVP
jgi:hypothetical protein